MYGLIEDLWEKFQEQLIEIATNLCLGCETPNDKLTVLFIASKCDIIQLDASDSKNVDDMMYKNASTGHLEGRVTSAIDDPDFVRQFF